MAELLQNIDQLSKGGLYIYGAGVVAQGFMEKIAQARPDIEFKGFLTTFETTDGATNASEAMADFDPSDTIIVLNQYAREIIHHLKDIGVKNRIYDGILQVFPWPSHRPHPALWGQAKKVPQYLKSERSREIYRFITDLRFDTATRP